MRAKYGTMKDWYWDLKLFSQPKMEQFLNLVGEQQKIEKVMI